jgi:hypothetical protein
MAARSKIPPEGGETVGKSFYGWFQVKQHDIRASS